MAREDFLFGGTVVKCFLFNIYAGLLFWGFFLAWMGGLGGGFGIGYFWYFIYIVIQGVEQSYH